METFFLIVAIMASIGFGLTLFHMLWSIYQKQRQEQQQAYRDWLAGRNEPSAPEPPAPEDDLAEFDDDFPEVEPEPTEPAPEPEPRIFAFVNGQSTYQMTEAAYQDWFERRQQRQAEIEQKLAELEQQRAAARAEAEAKAAAEAAAIAQLPGWLVEFAAQYELRRLDEIEVLQNWIALVLQFVQTEKGGQFPVKPVWKSIVAMYGAVAPESRFTSYVFFRRLSEALIEAGIVTRGRRGQAARLNFENLPRWVN